MTFDKALCPVLHSLLFSYCDYSGENENEKTKEKKKTNEQNKNIIIMIQGQCGM